MTGVPGGRALVAVGAQDMEALAEPGRLLGVKSVVLEGLADGVETTCSGLQHLSYTCIYIERN